MIDALMYGMMPREKIAQFSSAPPLKRLKSAATPPPAALSMTFGTNPAITAGLTPGSCDRSTQPHDHDDREREQNTPAQLRDFDRV